MSAFILPQLPKTRILHIEASEDTVTVVLEGTAREARCPACGRLSRVVHGWRQRTLLDLPLGPAALRIVVRLRRFRCDNAACSRRTIRAPLAGVAPYARRTARLEARLIQVALALGGRPGARYAREILRVRIHPTTLLRMLRRVPLPELETVHIAGIDEFAWRKGQKYGTIVVDQESHRVVALLLDNRPETVAAWLARHPELRILTRDRDAIYASVVREERPDVAQVADRWHLVQNLGKALRDLAERHPAVVEEKRLVHPPRAQQAPSARPTQGELRRQSRYEAIQRRLQEGQSIRAIARELSLDPRTVRKYARASSPPGHAAQGRKRPGILDPYQPLLEEAYRQGIRTAPALLERLRQAGYRGGLTTVRRWLAHRRAQDRGPEDTSRPLRRRIAAREIVSWCMKPPWRLSREAARILDDLFARDPLGREAYRLTQRFLALLRHKKASALRPWIERAKTSSVPELARFAYSLLRDEAAIHAALRLRWSQGVVEGQIQRLKLLKRMMYGRANPDLLAIRLLLTQGAAR
jgi:transposase